MKLLFLAHRIPYPPNKGDKIRSFHELRALAERGHEVHLLAFADELQDLAHQVDLAHWCASVRIVRLRPALATLKTAATCWRNRSMSLTYFDSWRMRRLVRRALAEHEFDAVFVYSSAMAQYVPQELTARTVVDLVDIDSEKWRAYALNARAPKARLFQVEAERLRAYEYEIVARFPYTVVTTQREAALLDELDEFTRRARLRVITNGVDLEYFQPQDVVALSDTPRLVFTGAMDYDANISGVRWFLTEVWPLVQASEPRTEFLVVGRNPTREVRAWRHLPGVRVTGAVEDVRPFLHSATAVVVPLRVARGVQNKVLEALAAGKALVATPDAVAGLRVTEQEQLLLGATPAAFADAVLKLLRDGEWRAFLGEQARRWVEREHRWQTPLQKLLELIEAVGTRPQTHNQTNVRALARH